MQQKKIEEEKEPEPIVQATTKVSIKPNFELPKSWVKNLIQLQVRQKMKKIEPLQLAEAAVT